MVSSINIRSTGNVARRAANLLEYRRIADNGIVDLAERVDP
jgi:hypothetical protein